MGVFKNLGFFFKILTMIATIATANAKASSNATPTLEQRLSQTLKTLRRLGADSVVTYQQYNDYNSNRVGNSVECAAGRGFRTSLVLWKLRGRVFAKKLDECFDYSTAVVNDSVLAFAYRNSAEISNEKFLPFETPHIVDGVVFGRLISTTTHVLQQHGTISNGKRTIRMHASADSRRRFSSDSTEENLNYTHNAMLKGTMLLDGLASLVRSLDSQGVFTRRTKDKKIGYEELGME